MALLASPKALVLSMTIISRDIIDLLLRMIIFAVDSLSIILIDKIFMKIIRWIISTPIAIALFIGLSPVFEWLLRWMFKILYYITCWGSKYDVLVISDLDLKILDLKSFIFITCFSTLLAAGCSGFIGGSICPPNNPIATTWLFSIVIIPVILLSIVSLWDSEHWFYSIIWIIDMILAALTFVCSAVKAQDND